MGYAALICLGLYLLGMAIYLIDGTRGNILSEALGILGGTGAWFFLGIWVGFDAYVRGIKYIFWALFTLVTGPAGLILYLLLRPSVPTVCASCGATLTSPSDPCAVCGRVTILGKAKPALVEVYSKLTDSLVTGPVERSSQTIKYMCIALAAATVIGAGVSKHNPILGLLWIIAAAAYWVLVAWWVYLDATWRKMDAVPWGVLTLLTNVIGLVTYLVIRYPEPRVCGKCGATLGIGLKRCPYCGSETEKTCPQCQASVQPDWLFCPACAGKIPSSKPVQSEAVQSLAAISIFGSVIDVASGSQIAGAEVRIDSKRESRSTVTNDEGKFVIPDLSPRPYVLVASANGYVEKSKPYSPSPKGPAQVDFQLVPVDVVN